MKTPWQLSVPPIYPPYEVACSGWVLRRLIRLIAEPFKKLSLWKLIPPGQLSTSVPSQTVQLGKFTIVWRGSDAEQPSLQISHPAVPNQVLWQSSPGCSFVSGGDVSLTITEERASIEIDEHKQSDFTNQTVDAIKQDGDTLEIQGHLQGKTPASDAPEYILSFHLAGQQELDFQLQIIGDDVNQTQFQFVTAPDEHFYGFGEQFSDVNCKGQWVPVICEEGGIGRGDRGPKFLNLIGVAGNRFSSYAPVPHFMTNQGRSVFLNNPEPSIFNLRDPHLATIRVMSNCMQGRILCGQNPLEMIELYTQSIGRMPPLPQWLNTGAVVGMQGGTDLVRHVWSQLKALDTPIAGFWLQDWVGQRKTVAGKQLWWNWQLDRTAYPDWDQLVADFAAVGIAVGVYLNPFLVNHQLPGQRNLYEEALDKGLIVKNKQGTPLLIESTDFSAALLDLSNPDTHHWFKGIIKEEVLGKGAKFWMTDFGEAAPFAGIYADADSGLTYHNHYPIDWATLHREAIREAGREGDAWFFNRSGFLHSPAHSTGMWLGDQNTTWGENDGLPSALKGMLSSGFSGFSISHSDTGGYTSIANPILKLFGVGFSRSKELLYRWMEMNAFTPIFRTHEGNQPGCNVQIYTNQETLTTFSYWAKVYAALADYRLQLMQEAATKGYPIVRHLVMHYPEDLTVGAIDDQFMLGSEFLVSPVMKPKQTQVDVYFPAGEWVHLWSGKSYGTPDRGVRQPVAAPIGQPPVFYRKRSTAAAAVVNILQDKGLLSGAPH